MRFVITGATGFIGQQLVPALNALGHELVLVGRDKQALDSIYPDQNNIGYDDLIAHAKDIDALIHLAVMNNNKEGELATFRKANVDLLQTIIDACRSANIPTLIYPSSVQAGMAKTPYAVSKSEAEQVLSQVDDLKVVTLRLPIVYADNAYSGKLSFLNHLPSALHGPLLGTLQTIKPVVHIDRIITAVEENATTDQSIDKIIANPQRENLLYRFTRKLIDIGFSLSILILLWWLMIILSIAIKLGSDGPAIFAQTRIGKYGKEFTCLKFRTMALGTKSAATHEVGASNVTKIGHFLRKTKLDELPQIFNILKNEMSLIGARPCLPVQTTLINERQKRNVLNDLPGITGWSQVQGVDMSKPIKLAKMDAEYIGRQSLLLDLKIILATATGKGIGDRVSKSD